VSNFVAFVTDGVWPRASLSDAKLPIYRMTHRQFATSMHGSSRYVKGLGHHQMSGATNTTVFGIVCMLHRIGYQGRASSVGRASSTIFSLFSTPSLGRLFSREGARTVCLHRHHTWPALTLGKGMRSPLVHPLLTAATDRWLARPRSTRARTPASRGRADSRSRGDPRCPASARRSGPRRRIVG